MSYDSLQLFKERLDFVKLWGVFVPKNCRSGKGLKVLFKLKIQRWRKKLSQIGWETVVALLVKGRESKNSNLLSVRCS